MYGGERRGPLDQTDTQQRETNEEHNPPVLYSVLNFSRALYPNYPTALNRNRSKPAMYRYDSKAPPVSEICELRFNVLLQYSG